MLLSDKVNIAEDIAHDQAGFMEPDTAEGTLRLLERWISAVPETRTAMAGRAIPCFRQRYDMRENAKTIMRLFESAKAKTSETETVSSRS